MLRFVPPAGVPLRTKQIFTALRSTLLSHKGKNEYFTGVNSRLKVRYVFGTCSGRAALWIVLKALQRLRPERNIVALPAYTCFSVPASIVRAGLKLQPVDIDAHTLDFKMSELQALADKRLLCVITSNLFGFPNDLLRIQQIAQSKGAFVVDDAAQAFGATRDGRFAGTLGDIGIYSLARGKAVTALEGGLIVTNSDQMAQAITEQIAILRAPRAGHTAKLLFETLVYSALLNPNLYWIPNSLPFLKLGVTEFNPEFATEELHPFCAALFDSALADSAEMSQIRQTNASVITSALCGTRYFEFPMPAPDSRPSFVRLPVIACDEEVRERAVNRLRKAGIGASPFYPSAICDIPGLDEHMSVSDFHRKQAELLSTRLFTLPVHPLLTSEDRSRIIDLLATF